MDAGRNLSSGCLPIGDPSIIHSAQGSALLPPLVQSRHRFDCIGLEAVASALWHDVRRPIVRM